MDIKILQALAKRQRYEALVGSVPKEMISSDTVSLLKWYDLYFKTHTEADVVNGKDLLDLIRLRCPNLTTEQLAIMKLQIGKIDEPLPSASLAGFINNLEDTSLAGRLGSLISRYNDGEEIDFAFEARELSQSTLRRRASEGGTVFDGGVDQIDSILAEVGVDQGFKFSMEPLRSGVTGLQGGDCVAIGARVNVGKSSFLALMAADFAKQRKALGMMDRPILYLNNEGTYKRLVPRIYTAVVGEDMAEMIRMSNSGELVPAYTKALHGDPYAIKFKDIHGWSMAQIERVIEEVKPCVVITDMLANVRVSGVVGGNKTDGLEAAWQQYRELAAIHDFVAVGTVQVSIEGDNMLFPPMSALKDSKTGLQGALDVLILLGMLIDPSYAAIRGIGTPKNKRVPIGGKANVQGEVIFDPDKCSYTSPERTVA